MKILTFTVIIILFLELLVIYRVFKDDIYLLDKEKPKLILWILVMPIVGVIIVSRKMGYVCLFFRSYESTKVTGNDMVDTVIDYNLDVESDFL